MLRKIGVLPGAVMVVALLMVGCNSKSTPSAAEIQAAKKAAAAQASPGGGDSGANKSFQAITPANSSRDPSNLDRQGTGLPAIGNPGDQ